MSTFPVESLNCVVDWPMLNLLLCFFNLNLFLIEILKLIDGWDPVQHSHVFLDLHILLYIIVKWEEFVIRQHMFKSI